MMQAQVEHKHAFQQPVLRMQPHHNAGAGLQLQVASSYAQTPLGKLPRNTMLTLSGLA